MYKTPITENIPLNNVVMLKYYEVVGWIEQFSIECRK